MNTEPRGRCDDQVTASLRPIDETFLPVVFDGQTALMADLLRAISGKADIEVQEAKPQTEDIGLGGDDAIAVNAKATDSEQTKYNVQLLSELGGTEPMRARGRMAILNSKLTPEQLESDSAPRSSLIIVSEADPFGAGKLLHSIAWRNEETGVVLDTGEDLWYLNTAFSGPPPEGRERLADWAHDFRTADPDEMRIPELAERVREVKAGMAQGC